MLKKCETCRKIFPDGHIYCPRDGTLLTPKRSTVKKNIFILLLGLGVIILVGVNLLPLYIRYASRNFDITLQGIELQPPPSIIQHPFDSAFQIWKSTLNSIIGQLMGQGGSDLNISGNFPLKVILRLTMKNRNFFTVRINSLKYHLYLGPYDLGSSSLPQSKLPLVLESDNPVELDLVTNISIPELLAKSLAAVIQGSYKYRLVGSVVVQTFFGKRTVNFDLNRSTLPFKSE